MSTINLAFSFSNQPFRLLHLRKSDLVQKVTLRASAGGEEIIAAVEAAFANTQFAIYLNSGFRILEVNNLGRGFKAILEPCATKGKLNIDDWNAYVDCSTFPHLISN